MQGKFLVILLVCFFALPGCAAWVRQVHPGKTIILSKNEALIFGKIIFIENNVVKTPYSFWTRKPSPTIFRLESKQYLRGREVEKDGSFYWIVPKGTYIISEVQYAYPVLTQVAFQVPDSSDAVYLGTLTLDVETGNMLLFRYVKKVKSTTVVDDFDNAKKTLLIRNQDITGSIEKNLMVHDESIPLDWRLIDKETYWDNILILFSPSFPLWQR